MTIELLPRGTGTLQPVRAQPGARCYALVGERAGRMLVKVSAAPERGEAIESVREVLAEALGVPRARIELVRGASAHDKMFFIEGLPPAAVLTLIETTPAPNMVKDQD